MVINTFDLWERNWKDAYNFFNSKGNSQTKSNLKDRWYKDFMEMFVIIEAEIKHQNDISDGISVDDT